MKGKDVQDEVVITATLRKRMELQSEITIKCYNRKGGNVLFVRGELQKDTLPWTITIERDTLGDYSVQDVIQGLQDLWTHAQILVEHIDTLEKTDAESEKSSEGK